ncbi:MAG: DNA mismatch repair protein MutS [Fusobacteriota bacterium]
MAKKETPLMKQYNRIKSKHKNSVLFFRLGDFYEMFFDDAKIVSEELGLTLTSRSKKKGKKVPMAGVPFHSSAQYISKLVERGYQVAICEQVEDANASKGIVKREVVRVITPGTVIDVDTLDEKSNNYIMGIFIGEKNSAISYMDITTGEFSTTQFSDEKHKENILNAIYKIGPKEIVSNEVTYNILKSELENLEDINDIIMNKYEFNENSTEYLEDYFGVVSLESYGLNNKKESIKISGLLLDYVLDLQNYSELPVNKIKYVNLNQYMELNLSTQRNLELIQTEKEKNKVGTLLWVLDYTKTSMGGRYLKKIIKNPLINIEDIKKRQKDIKYFIDEIIKREEIKEELKNIYDLERLMAKITLGTENARDLIAIKKSLDSIMKAKKILDKKNIINEKMENINKIYLMIENAIVEEPPHSIREGKMFKKGYDSKLDELLNISTKSKDYIANLEKEEKEKTGINSLKVGFNKVHGYYIQVTKKNTHLVPDEYIRKQTLANSERYITPELKEYESKILNAKDKIEALEYNLFKELSKKIKENISMFQNLANRVSYLDVMISLAESAIKNNYIKPELTQGYELQISDGRHPIVEKLIGEEEYIKNDIKLDEKEKMSILTGPNMAGKSTYMKQVALIILMAQIGSYVPASQARIGITDKIFTRVGASDNLVSGQSTFMVEMSEVANILNNATKKSFIILDEVGRGTSTFDGISIAWAITEYIHDEIGAKTIFATHYHELTDLGKRLDNLINLRVEVKENKNDVIFLRKIVRGGADKSYGIEVAKLAGLPKFILERSKKILNDKIKKQKMIEKTIKVTQLSLFNDNKNDDINYQVNEAKEENEVIMDLKDLDLNNMTPLDALVKLNELKKRVDNGGS